MERAKERRSAPSRVKERKAQARKQAQHQYSVSAAVAARASRQHRQYWQLLQMSVVRRVSYWR
jgi:hypothetical protein